MTIPRLTDDAQATELRSDLEIRRHIEAILELLSPRCSRCLHPLTAPKSIELGLGPVCRRFE